MDESTDIAAVRTRPGMYVGDPNDGSGLVHLVLDVVANAYDQYLANRCSRISLDIAADGTITVEDDGPGIPAAGGDGIPPLHDATVDPADGRWTPSTRASGPGWDGIVRGERVERAVRDRLGANPTKDRLDSPEARIPVREATQKALANWAASRGK